MQGEVERWDDRRHPALLQTGCKSKGLLVPVEMLMEKSLLWWEGEPWVCLVNVHACTQGRREEEAGNDKVLEKSVALFIKTNPFTAELLQEREVWQRREVSQGGGQQREYPPRPPGMRRFRKQSSGVA